MEKYQAAMGEEWEHAVQLETLASRLTLLDQEPINAGVTLTDSAVPPQKCEGVCGGDQYDAFDGSRGCAGFQQ